MAKKPFLCFLWPQYEIVLDLWLTKRWFPIKGITAHENRVYYYSRHAGNQLNQCV